jgi:hypothetical protein
MCATAAAESSAEYDSITLSTDLNADLIEHEDEIDGNFAVIISTSEQLAVIEEEPATMSQEAPEPSTVEPSSIISGDSVDSSVESTETATTDTAAIEAAAIEAAAIEAAAVEAAAIEIAAIEAAAIEAAAIEAAAIEAAAIDATTTEAPESSEPAQENVVDPDQLQLTLQQVVQGWAHAWSSQDVAGYLDYYASEFKPDNSALSRQQWQELRQSRLITPSHITLSLADLALIEFEKPVKELVFRQSYNSNIYSDVIVKSIKFVDQDGEWKILAEKTVRVIN